MALAYDATRVTRDIDATFVPHGVVIGEARHLQRSLPGHARAAGLADDLMCDDAYGHEGRRACG